MMLSLPDLPQTGQNFIRTPSMYGGGFGDTFINEAAGGHVGDCMLFRMINKNILEKMAAAVSSLDLAILKGFFSEYSGSLRGTSLVLAVVESE